MLVLGEHDEKGGWLVGVELEKLDDETYYFRMRAVGLRVREWDDRYIGLLVGAVERELPRKRGFQDVYHMAGVQARMPRKRVSAILAIARLIRCCPRLYRLFMRGEVSWTKVRVIARLASAERDLELCDLVSRLPRKQLEFWVREQMPGDARRSFWKAGEAGPKGASATGAPSGAGGGALPPAAATPAGSSAGTHEDAEAVAPGDSGIAGDRRWADRGVSSEGSGPSADTNPCAAESSPCAGGGPGSATADDPRATRDLGSRAAAGAPGELSLAASRGAATATGSATIGDATGFTQDPLPEDGGPARRARADIAGAKLVEIGVDPLLVDKLRVDAHTLSTSAGRPVSLVEALEHAMRDFRPAGPRLKIRTLRSVITCAECGCSLTPSAYGLLPLDRLDGPQLQQSGETIALTSGNASAAEAPTPVARSGRGRPTGKANPEGSVADSPDGRSVSSWGGEATRACLASTANANAVIDSAADHATIISAHDLPALQLRFVMARQGGRCGVRGCLRVLAECHHLDAFAVVRESDPDRTFLICREHHDAVHADLIANPGEPPDRWRVRRGWTEGEREVVDARMAEVNREVQRHRAKPARRDVALAQTMAAEAPMSLAPGSSGDDEPREEDDHNDGKPERRDDG